MRIAISDCQHICRVRRPELRRLAGFFLRRGRPPVGAAPGARLTLILLDDAGMREVNRRTFGRAETTDVISCTYAPIPGGTDAGADVFLNVERALAEGTRRRAWSPARELGLYLAHGLDHLGGSTDGTAAGRRRMRRRELRWLCEAGKARLLAGLWSASAPRRARDGRRA